MITCHDCGATVASVDEAVEADWLPNGDEYDPPFDGPICRPCWEKRDAEIARQEQEHRERVRAALLPVRSHGEACLISNALRECCRRWADEAQCHVRAALEKGDRAEADRLIALRDGYGDAERHYCAALDEIRRAFEARMDEERDRQEAEGGMPGNYTGYGNGSHAPCGN
jgi:hypothetical protein